MKRLTESDKSKESMKNVWKTWGNLFKKKRDTTEAVYLRPYF
tara:strand:- start:1776 stop:1901 length:126 start_codon:yes stop_codon:yes gene_type:complete